MTDKVIKKRNKDRRPDEPSFRFDRELLGLHITNRSGTRSWRQFGEDNGTLTQLAANGQVETLRLFKAGKLKMPALRAAAARGQLASGKLIADIKVREPLWSTLRETAKKMGKAKASRDRYLTSIDSLERKSVASGVLSDSATVADLEFIEWDDLLSQWDASGSDWNRMRAMLSAFCSKLLGNKQHDFRIRLLAKIPTADEVERTCAMNAGEFWRAVQKAPELVRPAYVALVATGMRWGEYAGCGKASLNHTNHLVRVPADPSGRVNAKKTAREVGVSDWLWPWIVAAIPAPFAYKYTRSQWRKACAKAGVPVVRLHDLRHLKGQLAIRKLDLSEVADDLGHTQLSTTRRYVRQANVERVAAAVGKALKPSGMTPRPGRRPSAKIHAARRVA